MLASESEPAEKVKRKKANAEASFAEIADEREMDEGKDAEVDEDSVDTLLASLSRDEANYRIFLRDELMTVANRQAAEYIMQLFPGPMSCNTISISGVHTNVPSADILAFAEVMKQA